MSGARKTRSRETERVVTEYFQGNGFPEARQVGPGLPGRDIQGIPGLAPEVKARRELRLTAWLRQADKYDGLSFVVHRPDGFGLATVELWPMTFRLGDGVRLLRDAGYGGK